MLSSLYMEVVYIMKGFIKSLLAIAVVLGIAFGAVKGFEYYNSNKADGDDSYKVETKRNSKYNGVYTLTKLDENGKNTWNGLIMYVKNDKIISANLVEFESREDIIKNKLDGKKDATDEEIFENASIVPKIKSGNAKTTGFGIMDYTMPNKHGVVVASGQMLFYDKKVNLENDYNDIKSCNAVAGYDEKSQEIWLSKLLSNEKSEYADRYKLIYYSSAKEIKEKCLINSGGCIRNLNQEFNAGLKDF